MESIQPRQRGGGTPFEHGFKNICENIATATLLSLLNMCDWPNMIPYLLLNENTNKKEKSGIDNTQDCTTVLLYLVIL